MSSIESGYSQADLRFFLPLKAGQLVGIFSGSIPLIETLKADGLEVISLSALEDRVVGLNHILIPVFDPEHECFSLTACFQRLKPGGWVLLGFHNSQVLADAFPIGRTPTRHSGSLHEITHVLRRSGLSVMHCYGAYHDLERPEIMVPLEKGRATRYFFGELALSSSRRAAWTRPLAIAFTALGLQRMLFRNLVVIARHEGGIQQ